MLEAPYPGSFAVRRRGSVAASLTSLPAVRSTPPLGVSWHYHPYIPDLFQPRRPKGPDLVAADTYLWLIVQGRNAQ